MAQGVDQIAAFNALKNGVDIKCYFGYKHKLHNVEEFLADSAIEVRYECPKFQDDCFFKRDRRIVDDCDLLIVVWDGIEIGGTFFTWKYAVKQGKKILMFPWNKGEQDNRVVSNFDSVEDEFN